MKEVKIFILRYLGWRNWSVLEYNSIIENLFIVFYIGFSREIDASHFIKNIIVFVLFSVSSTTYGYLVNDLADMELDAFQGKSNTFHGDSSRKAIVVVLFFAVLSILAGLNFTGNVIFVIFWLAWSLSATFYSLKPFRLKERGKTGLIIVVLAQRVLPILLLFAAFKFSAWIEVAVFTVYVLFRGLSSDLNHQLEDYENDAGTKTQTYAVTAGKERSRKLLRTSLEIEKILLLLVLALIYSSRQLPSFKGISAALPILVFYLALYVYSLLKGMKLTLEEINPFVSEKKHVFQFMHHGFPSVVLPLYMVLILTSLYWQFVVILVLLAAYRRLYSLQMILNSYPARLLKRIAPRRTL
ncbi:MAG: UbiA family prenyltransferase [Syntrophotaleaceae bacterium]